MPIKVKAQCPQCKNYQDEYVTQDDFGRPHPLLTICRVCMVPFKILIDVSVWTINMLARSRQNESED